MRTTVPIRDLGCDGSLGCDCLKRREKDPSHGDRSRYVRKGCRCLKCREANTEYHRQWRERKNQENQWTSEPSN